MWAQTSQEVVWSDQWGEISFRTAIGDGTTNTRDLCSGVARLEAVFLGGSRIRRAGRDRPPSRTQSPISCFVAGRGPTTSSMKS